MDATEYKKALKALNNEQREAVETIEGPVIVIAGPGTGKTQILTTRIAHILHETDTPPNGILALTYTDAGVIAMKKRLSELIGRAAEGVTITTFHSFANSIIQEFPDSFSKIIGARQIEELEQLELVESIIHNGDYTLLKPLGNPMYYARELPRVISEIKREGLDPQNFKQLVKRQLKEYDSIPDLVHERGKYAGETKGKYRTLKKKIEKNLELQRFFEEYEQEKYEKRVFDYDDAILELLRALKEDQDLLLTLQERFLYIHVDEHQDSNGAQNKIINLISSFHENPNLFIVGDDKQAIYRFQGASPENFLYFSKRHSDAHVIELTENYRSHKHLLDLAHELIQHNPTLSEKPLKQASKLKSFVAETVNVQTEAEQAEYVAKKVLELRSEEPEKTIAVLYRKNKEASLLEAALAKEGVLFSKFSGSRNELHRYTEQLVLFLRIAAEPKEEFVAQALFFDCFQLDILEVATLLEKAHTSKKSLFEVAKDEDSAVSNTVKLLLGLHKRSHNTTLFELFDEALYSTGLMSEILRAPNNEPLLDEINWLHGLAKSLRGREQGASIQNLIDLFDRAMEHNMIRVRGRTRNGQVVLSTVHGVKGLEFDTVLLTGLTSKHWGGRKQREYFYIPEFRGQSVGEEDRTIEDERRLFYVAITRAKEKLFLVAPLSDEEGKELLPTPFITEASPYLDAVSFQTKEVVSIPRPQTFKQDLLDLDYISERFYKSSLNATAINKYLRCPWEYFFQTLLRIPRAQHPSAQYGTAIHETLRWFFSERSAGRRPSDEEIGGYIKGELEATELSNDEKRRYGERGTKNLVGYISAREDMWPQINEVERSVRGVTLEVQGRQVYLSGMIDKIESAENGLIVTDFKTGKPKSRGQIEGTTKDSNGDYKRQLVFYSLLLSGAGEIMKEGTIDFVEPTDSGAYKQERFTVSKEDQEGLVKTINDIADEILSGAFVEKGCKKKTCEWCRLSESLIR